MEFSVIIPTKNEEKYLPRLLEGLKRQKEYRWGRDFEVIVLDGYSTDRTVEIARRYGCIVKRTRAWPIGKTRNIGARMAKGRILVFMDADVEVLPYSLREIKEKLDSGCDYILYRLEGGNILQTMNSAITMIIARIISTYHTGG